MKLENVVYVDTSIIYFNFEKKKKYNLLVLNRYEEGPKMLVSRPLRPNGLADLNYEKKRYLALLKKFKNVG